MTEKNADIAVKVIQCESQFKPIQSNIVRNGKREESYGIVQIHLPSHPTITKEQAMDVEYSLLFMKEQFELGNHDIWSCYKIHYGLR